MKTDDLSKLDWRALADQNFRDAAVELLAHQDGFEMEKARETVDLYDELREAAAWSSAPFGHATDQVTGSVIEPPDWPAPIDGTPETFKAAERELEAEALTATEIAHRDLEARAPVEAEADWRGWSRAAKACPDCDWYGTPSGPILCQKHRRSERPDSEAAERKLAAEAQEGERKACVMGGDHEWLQVYDSKVNRLDFERCSYCDAERPAVEQSEPAEAAVRGLDLEKVERPETFEAAPRLMRCPFCGHECESAGIGTIFCGPHGEGKDATPARRMVEIVSSVAGEREPRPCTLPIEIEADPGANSGTISITDDLESPVICLEREGRVWIWTVYFPGGTICRYNASNGEVIAMLKKSAADRDLGIKGEMLAQGSTADEQLREDLKSDPGEAQMFGDEARRRSFDHQVELDHQRRAEEETELQDDRDRDDRDRDGHEADLDVMEVGS